MTTLWTDVLDIFHQPLPKRFDSGILYPPAEDVKVSCRECTSLACAVVKASIITTKRSKTKRSNVANYLPHLMGGIPRYKQYRFAFTSLLLILYSSFKIKARRNQVVPGITRNFRHSTTGTRILALCRAKGS